MRKGIVVLLFLCIGIAAFAQKKITKEIVSFTELKVFDKIKVTLIPSTENKLEITGLQNNEVDIVQSNEVLKIKMSLNNIWENNNTKVTLYCKGVSIIDVNEGSKVSIEGELKTENLDLRAQEGADIIGKIVTDKLFAKAVTGGELVLSGTATAQEVIVKAGGQFLSKELSTETTRVKISAGGEAIVNASKYVKANTTAGGIIRIYGNPNEIDQRKVFGGKIITVH